MALGKGKRLFDSGTVPAVLRLVDSAVFPNGRLKLDFATGGEPKFGNVGGPEEALRRLTRPETDRTLTGLHRRDGSSRR